MTTYALEVDCPRCGARITPNHIHQMHRRAQCAACRLVFDCGAPRRQAASTDAWPEAAQRRRRPVPMPANITVIKSTEPLRRRSLYRGAVRAPGELTIVRHWRSLGALAGLVIGIGLSVIGSYAGWAAATIALEVKRSDALDMTEWALLHLIPGCVILYFSVVRLVNRSVISVTPSQLSIANGPLPWWTYQHIPTGEIAQLFCEREEPGDKHDLDTTAVYHLNALLRDGERVRLLSALPSPDQALFLEQTIEKWLDITDEAEYGAYTG